MGTGFPAIDIRNPQSALYKSICKVNQAIASKVNVGGVGISDVSMADVIRIFNDTIDGGKRSAYV